MTYNSLINWNGLDCLQLSEFFSESLTLIQQWHTFLGLSGFVFKVCVLSLGVYLDFSEEKK